MSFLLRYAPKFIILLLAVSLLSSCIDKPEKEIERLQKISEEEYLAEARKKVNEGSTVPGGKMLEEFEKYHPFSEKLIPVLVEAIEVYYGNGYYDFSTSLCERFLGLYPRDKNNPFVLFTLAMSYYQQTGYPGKDGTIRRQAYLGFSNLIRSYPEDNIYVKKAAIMIDAIVEEMANAELERGVSYLKSKDYTSAASRFIDVIKKYPDTYYVPEAMYRMVEIYVTLGIDSEALRTAKILGHNYRGSYWYKLAYELLQENGLYPKDGEEYQFDEPNYTGQPPTENSENTL